MIYNKKTNLHYSKLKANDFKKINTECNRLLSIAKLTLYSVSLHFILFCINL